ncbi:uncharacterized protein C9orf50 homolog [Ochotona curzoniae]|uniref:uncharacterized protein C9orf50 homolog n=1 Tax=Ochotona curzoniae TaxID=130825 RepID=UPI001B3508CF|nr:uncharacterized protein C9orf50 homolog [Ochotona curzoniae]
MSGRHPRSGTREVAPRGYPGGHHHHHLRPREPRLPRLSPSEPRAARGGAWWLELDSEPTPPPLRAVPTAAPSGAAHSRSVLESLLLPPLPSAPRRPGPRVGQDARGGLAGEPSDSLGALLGDLLPSRFRRFLSQLRDKCTEQLEPQMVLTTHQACVSSPRAPSSYFQDSLKKLLLHQLSALTPLRGDHSPLTTVKKHPSAQPSRLKAALAQGSQRESSGPRRRVRFADETLRDSALRYWERNYAAQQNFTGSRLPTVSSEVTEQVAESIKRWLQNLPRSLQLLAKDESRASLPRWAAPDRPAPQLLERQVEDTPVSYRQPFPPKASTQRPRRNLKTFLDTLGQVDQESLLPSLVLQSVLRRSRPRGYQLLLPSLATQRAQRCPGTSPVTSAQRVWGSGSRHQGLVRLQLHGLHLCLPRSPLPGDVRVRMSLRAPGAALEPQAELSPPGAQEPEKNEFSCRSVAVSIDRARAGGRSRSCLRAIIGKKLGRPPRPN